jgi:hypothetical protein
LNDLAIHTAIDELEAEIKNHEPVDCPLTHIFTPYLYTRQIFMPAGTLIVSKIHKFQHPFIISKGIARVKINDGEWERLEAPYTGITEPGTRRVLYIEEDCIWTTFHVTDLYPGSESKEAIQATVDKIEEIIIEKRENLVFENKNESPLIEIL